MATARPRISVLFVCMGNICRSPTAEAVVREFARREAKFALEVDSAGTHGYHAGDPPDERSIEAARRRGFDLSKLRARVVESADFERFDLVLAMDDRGPRPTARNRARPPCRPPEDCSWTSHRRSARVTCRTRTTAVLRDSRKCSTWSRRARAACWPRSPRAADSLLRVEVLAFARRRLPHRVIPAGSRRRRSSGGGAADTGSRAGSGAVSNEVEAAGVAGDCSGLPEPHCPATRCRRCLAAIGCVSFGR